MKYKNRLLTIAFVLCIVSFIGTIFVYPKLPLEVPIHFNLAGEIDQYGSSSIVFFTALLPTMLLGLFLVLPKIDPKKKSYKQHSKAYNIFNFAICLFLMIIHWCTILVAFDFSLSIRKIVPILVGILFIIIGNYMPQIRQNYTFGIRIPWALENPDNWRITHRIGGYSFIGCGLLFIISSFFNPTIQGVLTTVALALVLIVPTLVSYFYYRKSNHS